jgi:lysophospholipase L1-like esterase
MTFWIWAIGLAAAASLLAEMACRWWVRHRSGYYVWPPGKRLEVRLDRNVFPDGERSVRFDVNADGERGGDVPSPDGLYRILATGGSATECYALDQPTTWPGALEGLLRAPDKLRALGARRVHVGNIGRSYIGSAELDLVLERVLPQYRRLDAIVIMVGAGDVVQWLEEGAPPSLPPARIPAARIFSRHPEQRFGWKPSQLALIEVGRRLRRSLLRPREVEERAGAWYATARRMRAEAKEMRTTVPDPAVMVDRFEHYFRLALSRAKGHAERVIVARQPWFEKDYTAAEAAQFWHAGLGKAWKGPITVYYSLEVVNRLMGLVDSRAATVAVECGVEQIDLQSLVTPGLEHYYDHTHFTPAGAAVVAEALVAALTRETGRRAAREPSYTSTRVASASSMPRR